MSEFEDGGQEKPEVARRDFLKRMAAFAFAVPVISSFTLDAISYAGQTSQAHSNQFFPNQSVANQEQCFTNQFFGNQGFPNQSFANQTFPNQYSPNQFD